MSIDKENGDVISFLKRKSYIMINKNLGGGSFGKTVLLKDPYIDELFVAKKYEPEYEEIREVFYRNFLDEIKILYRLNHLNIVRIFNYYAYEESYTGYIIMEFIEGQNIGDYYRNYEEEDSLLFDKPSPDDIFRQLIDAFCYIEEHQIIHRDIREGNIMIDNNGIVKVIDFGIGKIYDSSNSTDSLVNNINREDADTLPMEYYSGEYTSLTDMFYLGELLNRLMITSPHSNDMHFSYQGILDKMMCKDPSKRFSSFNEIRNAIDKLDFTELDISEEDKRVYQNFSEAISDVILYYLSKPSFISDPNVVISKLKNVVKLNSFEEYIQNNNDIINCIVTCSYKYHANMKISVEKIKVFIRWFEACNIDSQQLVISNLINKLSAIKYEESYNDIPF